MVPLLQVSAPVGAPVAPGSVLSGHSTVLSPGKPTKVGAVVSLTVMLWDWTGRRLHSWHHIQWRAVFFLNQIMQAALGFSAAGARWRLPFGAGSFRGPLRPRLCRSRRSP